MTNKDGQTPKDWATISLGDVVEFHMGQAPPSNECNRIGKGTPFVKVGEFGDERPIIREWTTKPLRLARPEDVLICVVGATIGKLNLGISCAIGRSVSSIRPYKGITSKYLYYQLFPKMLHLRISSSGSAQGVISKTYLSEIDFHLAPLVEQRAIVAKIESLFSELDQGVEQLKAVQQQLKRYRQSVLKAAFEGKLTNAELENGLPAGWKRLSLENVTLEKDGLRRGPFGSAIKKAFFVSEGYKVYEQGNAINDDPYRVRYYISKCPFGKHA